MTAEQIEQLTKEIIANLEFGADLAGIFAPEIIPFVVMGKAMDKIIPGLAGMVERWVEGNPPTEEEKAKLKEMLATLGDPNLP